MKQKTKEKLSSFFASALVIVALIACIAFFMIVAKDNQNNNSCLKDISIATCESSNSTFGGLKFGMNKFTYHNGFYCVNEDRSRTSYFFTPEELERCTR